MSSRLDMLAAAALQGLCASHRARQGVDPHQPGDEAGVAARALALGKALDALLEADEEQATAPAPVIGDTKATVVPARKR